jgi:hypothetical protein
MVSAPRKICGARIGSSVLSCLMSGINGNYLLSRLRQRDTIGQDANRTYSFAFDSGTGPAEPGDRGAARSRKAPWTSAEESYLDHRRGRAEKEESVQRRYAEKDGPRAKETLGRAKNGEVVLPKSIHNRALRGVGSGVLACRPIRSGNGVAVWFEIRFG